MMTYKVIAMEEDVRKDHFAYFQGMGYPYMGVTVNVDITDWLAAVKSQKLPFFHSFLYVVANAANQVPQLRQRIKDGVVIEYEHCPGLHLNLFFEQLHAQLKAFVSYSKSQ